MTRWIMPGTKIFIRKPGAYRPDGYGDWKHHKTTKPVDVPADARITVAGGWVPVAEFVHEGWEIQVDTRLLARGTTRAERDATGECPRCGGRGNIPAFSHVQGGVCFKCGGTGSPLIPLPGA